MSTFGALDVPVEGETVAREGFLVTGFAYNEDSGPFARVSVKHQGLEIGSTSIHDFRPDLAPAIPAIRDPASGYRLTATFPAAVSQGPQVIEIEATFENGTSWGARRRIVCPARDYRTSPYGTLLWDDLTHVYKRHDIYSVGPPSEAASVECVALLRSYLAPGERVIDVGCGVGAYAAPLLAAGIDWHGCEVNAAFVDQVRGRGLTVSLVDGPALPFADGAFESALCIEVLEHIEDYDSFLVDVARIASRRALFSVPNAEAIPVLADQLVVPWHLLEADHKNFFTRAGLRATLERRFRHVEIIPYGIMPLSSSNGTPVFYHLFASAQL